MILEYILKDDDDTKTINQILQFQFDLSNRLFNTLINNKRIYLNGEEVDTRYYANLGDKITIDLNYEEDCSNIKPIKMDLDIVYEDEALIVLNKPAGIAVHPSFSHYEDSFSNGVRFYFDSIGLHKKIRPVNRLDFNTSGLIIFAKNEYVQENLIRQMATGSFKKQYLAVVQGILEKPIDTIKAPIARKENSIIERCVSPDGQQAVTEYEVLETYNNCSLVKCNLLTGRTHQIRVHFAYIGHPLLGDTLYGSESNLINRQALHSYMMSFINPINSNYIQIICNIPSDIIHIFKD